MKRTSAQIEILKAVIEDIDTDNPMPSGFKQSLINKLDQVVVLLDQGKFKTAANNMKAFINHVNAQVGKKLISGQADLLAPRANAIRTAIGGL